MSDFKWEAIQPIPRTKSTEDAEVGKYIGIPYSSAKQVSGFVPTNVSFRTFLSASKNRYSLLYTENIANESSKSAYGFNYVGDNCGSYYGTVCS